MNQIEKQKYQSNISCILEGFSSRVDHMINSLHGEVECHEFTDGSESSLKTKPQIINIWSTL